jgi:hypothetical protein
VLATTLVVASYEREEESSLFLPLVFISLITVMGVFGRLFHFVLVPL